MLKDAEALEMLEACEGADGLSTWEEGFIESMRKLADDSDEKDLTDNQRAKLTQIYDEHCA